MQINADGVWTGQHEKRKYPRNTEKVDKIQKAVHIITEYIYGY
jgi:hypothetical protein